MQKFQIDLRVYCLGQGGKDRDEFPKLSQIKYGFMVNERKKQNRFLRRPLTSTASAADGLVPHPLVGQPFGEHQAVLMSNFLNV